jgi:hypothetical protein
MYRRPRHAGSYLDFISDHPKHVKRGIVFVAWSVEPNSYVWIFKKKFLLVGTTARLGSLLKLNIHYMGYCWKLDLLEMLTRQGSVFIIPCDCDRHWQNRWTF